MAWSDILGQEFAKRILKTHLASGQVAGAYLLAGPEGVGKRRLALEMAKALNCTERSGDPCDRCPSCRQIIRRVHPDVHELSPSGVSEQIKIDDVRHLLARLALRPFSGGAQVVIIDGAERLTEEAANSLLKTLEEPSRSTKFCLLTSQPALCLPTIVSRCQMLRCLRLSSDVVASHLMTHAQVTPDVAHQIARLSYGSLAAAEELAKRWQRYDETVERFAHSALSAWIEQPLPESRQDVALLLDCAIHWLRDLAVIRCGSEVLLANTEARDPLRHQAQTVALDDLLESAFRLQELYDSLEQFVSPKLVASLAREEMIELLHTLSPQSTVHSPR